MNTPPQEPTEPAPALTRKSAAGVILLYGLVALAIVPVAAGPAAEAPGITAAFGGVVLATDLATSFVLLSLFFESPLRSVLALACAYLFSALMVVPHVLAFPGAIVPGQAIIGGPQSSGWLFVLWINGYAIICLIAVAFATCTSERPLQMAAAVRAGVAAVCAVVAAATLLTFLATAFADQLPALVAGASWTLLNRLITACALTTLAVAIGMCLWRPRSPLLLWLSLALTAIAFANLLSDLAGARYTVGWAAAGVSWVISACTVLAYLVRHLVRQHGMLRSTERHFQILVEGVRDYAIFMLDPTGHITSWNPGAEHIKGYRSEEIIGQHFSRFYTPADRAANVPGHALREAAEKGKYEAENWRMRKDGSSFFASVVIDAIRDRSGRLIGFAKVTRDITERRRAQEQLEEARVRLFQSQKMEAVGQLTGGVAHDFNNLLTIILGNLDIASRHVGSLSGGIADQLKRLLGNARTGAQRAATLTQRLLVFSRRQPLNPKVLDVTRFITGSVEFLQRSLGERIHIEAAGSAGLWAIEADPHQLEAALLNLAVNARDAMPDGGKLSLGASNVAVDESYSRANPEIAPGQYVVICVTDTGTGMSQETVARAFEPFFTTKEVGQGTGLGLSQVYGFVKQSGGHVKVYSEVGYGTTVKIYLPRFVGVNGAQEAEALAPPGISLGETILVVEDDPDVRSYVVEALRALDYNVLEAGEAHAAIRAVEQRDGDIDLVLSDVILPGKNGRELVRELHTRWPALRVLYMTGYSRDAIVHQGRLDPGVEVIQKPLVHAELADRIRTILER